jgi:hypothetical protein
MQRLPEIQAHFRDAIVYGKTNGISQTLIGGLDPQKRLAIHQRNYHVSLTDALVTKFPATEWLLGTRSITEAAGRFIHEYPPQGPCIAEYGRKFPDFLGQCAPHLPYVRDFASLEWLVGMAAIAVDQPSLDAHAFSQIDTLLDAVVTFQIGVHYLHASWPIDDLLKAYLTDNVPDQFELMPNPVWVEIRGARGEFQLNRLAEGECLFRQALSEGIPIGDAAERALEANPGFDAGRALTAILATGLVTGACLGSAEETNGKL